MCVIYEKGKIRIKKTFVRQRGIDKAGNAVIINNVVKKLHIVPIEGCRKEALCPPKE